MPVRRAPRLRAAAILAAGVAVVSPAVALAHGTVPPEPPSLATLLFDWQLEPVLAGSLLAAAAGWLWVLWRVRSAHPDHPVPVLRTVAFVGGLAVIAVALLSGIDSYATTLFSVHMVQHLLLMLVAAPLLALAAPVTQLLRAASPAARQRWLVPVLHSGPVAAIGNPVVAWLTFTLVMWVSHFSPLFDLALESEGVHTLEHVAFLVAGLLFWWPVVGADPARQRLTYPVRALYVLAQMPPSSFLGMAILFASAPLYPHYATLGSPYGIDALADQELAGGIMWLAGDVAFIAGILGVVTAWMRHADRDSAAADRRADAERARIGARADQLARAREVSSAGDRGNYGSGDSSSSR